MKRWLDRVTGRITMYKLVLTALGAISVFALVLSLFGLLGPYTPVQLLATFAVSGIVTTGVGLAIAKLLRITPHLESSFITASILFFIMQPTVDPLGLAGVALAGAVASLSKYLIAVRGRHVFNPAAFGAFVAGLITFATLVRFSLPVWWVGTPALLPVVVLGGFLVLYRTQRLTMGVTFILVAAIVGVGGALLRGAAPSEALSFALLSSPLIFFGCFMLTEPLTLPPRRWQQLVQAGIVALLLSVPFTFGLISNTPEFALLVGNLLAFLVGQRRGISLTYLGKKLIGAATWELSFQSARAVRFLPGQYMELVLPHRQADFRGSRRYFSISSAPGVDAPITFAITKPSTSSSFKNALLELEPGAVVRGTGVGGDFALPADLTEPLLLVAGGIGITPFASQLAHAEARGDQRDITLVYALSTTGDIPYASLLERAGTHVVLFAPEAPSPLPAGWEYAGSGRVTGDRLAEAVPDVAKRRAFVSGPPALVSDLRSALRSQGATRVHSDYFSGY